MKINALLTEQMIIKEQILNERTYKEFRALGNMLLNEYAMSQEQIQQLFQQVADGAAQGGNVDKEGDAAVSNRTMLGKGADAAAKVAAKWEQVKTKISQSAPVAGFDAAVDSIQSQLTQAAGGDKGKINQAIQKYRDFAHEYPIMQGAIYAGLIALAGISGAGLGGAALLGGVKIFDRLLQGDKASSALWRGFKTGALAYGAGQLGQAAQTKPSTSAFDAGQGQDWGGDNAGAFDAGQGQDWDNANATAGTVNANDSLGNGETVMPATGGEYDFAAHSHEYTVKPGDNLSTILDKAKVNPELARHLNPDLFGPDGNPNILRAGQTIRLPDADALDDMNKMIYTGPGDQIGQYHGQYAPGNPSSLDATHIQKQIDTGRYGPDNGMAAGRIAQDVAKAGKNFVRAGYENPKRMIREHAGMYYIDRETTARRWVLNEQLGRPRGNYYLTPVGVSAVFEEVARRSLNEGPIWDKVKSGAKAVGGVLQKGTQAVGKAGANAWDAMANDITYKKLDLNWRRNYKEFDPTGGKGAVDSEQVIAFLKKQGVKDPLITSSFTALGLQAPQPKVQPSPAQGQVGGAAPATVSQPGAQQGEPVSQPSSSYYSDAPTQAQSQPAGGNGAININITNKNKNKNKNKKKDKNVQPQAATTPATTAATTTPVAPAPVGKYNIGQPASVNGVNINQKATANAPGWNDPKSANYVGRREVARRQAQAVPNYGQQMPAAGKVTYNAPTGLNMNQFKPQGTPQGTTYDTRASKKPVDKVPVPDQTMKQKEMAGKINPGTPVTEMSQDFSATLLNKMAKE